MAVSVPFCIKKNSNYHVEKDVISVSKFCKLSVYIILKAVFQNLMQYIIAINSILSLFF